MYLRLLQEIWESIFAFLTFSEVLGLEVVCGRFKDWIRSVDGPRSKMHAVTFCLQLSEGIFASVKRSGPELDELKWRKILEVADVLC